MPELIEQRQIAPAYLGCRERDVAVLTIVVMILPVRLSAVALATMCDVLGILCNTTVKRVCLAVLAGRRAVWDE